nr:MAG TPA: hypothetical protein [Caudoviricetes sp.]
MFLLKRQVSSNSKIKMGRCKRKVNTCSRLG